MKVQSVFGECGLFGETLVTLWKDKAEGWVRPDGTLECPALYPAGARKGV